MKALVETREAFGLWQVRETVRDLFLDAPSGVVEVDRPPTGEGIKGGDHLGGVSRVPEGITHVDHAEADTVRPPGEDGKGCPPLEDGAVDPKDEVVGHPKGVKAQLLREDARLNRSNRVKSYQARSAEQGRAGTGKARDAETKLHAARTSETRVRK